MPNSMVDRESSFGSGGSLARLCGACCGLFLFGAILLVGAYEGADVERVLLRAIIGLFGGLIFGMIVGQVGTYILQDGPLASQTSENEKPVETENTRATTTAASRV